MLASSLFLSFLDYKTHSNSCLTLCLQFEHDRPTLKTLVGWAKTGPASEIPAAHRTLTD